MEYANAITVEQPAERAILLAIDQEADGITLAVEVGNAVARLSLTRIEARTWRRAIGAALNSPSAGTPPR